jgi:hypothetical protein
MNKFDYYDDLYGITLQNTNLCEEHRKLYEKYRATSIGDLLDSMQNIINRYERAMDHSTTEINELKDEKATNEKIIAEQEVTIANLRLISGELNISRVVTNNV